MASNEVVAANVGWQLFARSGQAGIYQHSEYFTAGDLPKAPTCLAV